MRLIPQPVRGRLAAVFVASVIAATASAAGCSSGGTSSATDQAYLSEVHGSAPDIARYRNDSQLVRLGHAVCDDFGAGASYQAVADRLTVGAGSRTLPTADLGAVITAAAGHYCPKYQGAVS